jgi:ppGpp synthetase/RelA/SpoT-type nucleotidyltranferase
MVPESPSEFGYEGKHYVLFLPKDLLTPELPREDCPTFFELQIKTLFQHAWAQADHDLAYKPPEELTRDQKRKIAFTAAQAWGADLVFDELASELAKSDAV